MTRGEAVNWLINIMADIGKAEHRDLWHYEQALCEIRDMLEYAPDTNVDTISRQAAIDLLKQMRKDGDMIPWEGKDVFARIRKLPSAQPDIIHCRDCRHHRRDNTGCYYCVRKEYGYGWGLNDFCSDAERREDERTD